MGLENLEGLLGMTVEGESLRNEDMEKEGTSFNWQTDILTYDDFWEIEMMYIFSDPNEEIFTELDNSPRAYKCEITDSVYYPNIDNYDGRTFVLAHMPIEKSLDHEIAEFPRQYLEELRDGFYDQVISLKLD